MTHIPEDYMGAPDPLDPNPRMELANVLPNIYVPYMQSNMAYTQPLPAVLPLLAPIFRLDIHFAIGNFIRDAMKADQSSSRGMEHRAVPIFTPRILQYGCGQFSCGASLGARIMSGVTSRVPLLMLHSAWQSSFNLKLWPKFVKR